MPPVLDPHLEDACKVALAEFTSLRPADTGGNRCEAHLIRNFFSGSDIEMIFQAERLCEARAYDEGSWARRIDDDGDPMPDPFTVCETLKRVPHDLAFSSDHVALFLHRDGYFQDCCEALLAKLFQEVRTQNHMWDETVDILNVRCIELHSYATGGGLLTPGHRDVGSVITIAVLLSDENDLEGGQFVTFSEGLPVVHEMKQGDALVFQSEQYHNVATVVHGSRRSLVMELWRGSTNVKNRFG